MYTPGEKEENILVEIQTKGTCKSRLVDFGVKEGSTIVMKQSIDEFKSGNGSTIDYVASALRIKLPTKSI